jgi:hypothetical protein
MFAFDGRKSANAGSDEHSDTRGRFRRDRQPGVINGILRSGHRELNEDIHLLQFFLLDELQGIEPLHLARKLRGKARRVEAGDGADAAFPGTQRIPVGCGPDADG